MEDVWGESAPSQDLTGKPNSLLASLSINRTRAYHRDMTEFVRQDATKYLKRVALKCQVLAVWEGGLECVQNVMVKWKDEGTMLKDMEDPITHPANWNSSENEMTECVD